MAAEPSKETAAPPPPPPPRETETVDGRPAEAATADIVAPLTSEPAAAPHAVVEPGEETTTPPPPPRETEPTDGVAPAVDPALPTAESARQAPQQEKPDAAAAGQPQQTTTESSGLPPTPAKVEEVAALPPLAETPSLGKVVTAAVEAENQLPVAAGPAPSQQQSPQQQKQESGAAKEASSVHEGKDAAPVEPASGSKEQKPAPAPKPYGKDNTGGVLDKPVVKRKDEGEESKRRHDDTLAAPAEETKSPRRAESQAGAVAGGDAGPGGTPAGKTTTTSPPGSLVKRFQKVCKRLLRILSWYKDHRSSTVGGDPQAGALPMEEGKGSDEVKPATAPDGDKVADAGTTASPADGKQAVSGSVEEEKPKKPPHPKWAEEEKRLEEILEGAFTRLLAAEYLELPLVRKKCLLTFSVFDLASNVKKQVMVYWWVSEFNLQHRSDQSVKSATDAAAPAEARRSSCWPAHKTAAAGGSHPPAPEGGNKAEKGGGNPDTEAEGIFSELSSDGFLEPMKNWCSKVIHGCKVNPLVHWMLKRRARDDRFADLDVEGSPAVLQSSSSILCLTRDNRALLQKMRMKDESQQAGIKTNATRTNSQKSSTVQEEAPGQKMCMKDESQQAGTKTNATRTNSQQSSTIQEEAPAQEQKNTESNYNDEEIAKLFKGKQVIINVNAHVYPVSKSTFLNLADSLVVLQLGRWCSLDDNTYMEVNGLESLSTIGSLKNLRYLSLRGLSQLTELPKGIRYLRKLAILDMRGCQNLVNVASKITASLRHLTHLDLTDCYMLEHIGRGITSLSELQVLKGFVFATGTQDNKACRLQDLKRLKKLQKLTVRITTDANVGESEMRDLKLLIRLRKLTITWSEIPSILDGESVEVKDKRDDLIKKWTNFELPQELLKLDLRCYPKNELKLKVHENLKKLYLRGGDLEKFSVDSIGESKSSDASKNINYIKTLRLRYLKNFIMEWEEIRSLLMNVEYVEIVTKDEKPMKDVNKDQKDIEEESKVVKDVEMKGQNDIKEERKLVKKKKIIYSTLDENGVWVKDEKEEKIIAHARKEKEAHDDIKMSKVSGPTEDTEKAASIIKDANEDDTTIKGQSEGKQEHVATEMPLTEPTPIS